MSKSSFPSAGSHRGPSTPLFSVDPVHVVVTGAAGFVGGFVARWLAARGFAVTAIARRAPPRSEALPLGLSWRVADLRAASALPARFDVLVHCAAVLPSACPDPDLLYRDNAMLARAAFAGAVAGGVRSVVNLSSMSVYGAIATALVDEDLPPRNADAYGRAKIEAEALLASLVEGQSCAALSIRLPGTVGKGSHHNFLSDTMGRVLHGDTVIANHPDSPFNNIVYVGHLAAFVEEWIRSASPGQAVVNLAAAEAMPLREVLTLMAREAGRPARIEFVSGGKSPFLIAIDRACALGYRAPTVRASIAAMVRDCLAPEGKEGWRLSS